MTHQDVIIGKTIEYFLKEKKMPKGVLAEHLNISPAIITGMLTGKTRLTLNRFFEICKILEVSPTKFINRMGKAVETVHIKVTV